MPPRRAPPRNANDPERLLLVLADHLHEHCECPTNRAAGPRCAACDLRGELRRTRDELLAWRAEGRRLAVRRAEAIANGGDHAGRLRARCADCDGLAALAETMRGPALQPDPYSSDTSSA